ELFAGSLKGGGAVQGLLLWGLGESLYEGVGPVKNCVRASGDDLVILVGELSVSFMTPSHASALLTAGSDIHPPGAPVPAIGLNELGVDPAAWASEALERFADEWSGLAWACAKVRPVV